MRVPTLGRHVRCHAPSRRYYLDGGRGNDRIFDRASNDILIGGLGADQLDGGDGDDLIIMDALTSVPGKTDPDRLIAVWTDTSETVAHRVLTLTDDLLAAIQTDGSEDPARSERGIDAYFASAEDGLRLRPGDDLVRRI
ncbi:hypothetical protein [Neorhodopirellula lusitana]|uniref:hypothetical protein n=1 Tax=Neorhodopirellula lusitana TaxID=445327 RepID=UPI0024B77AEB|nr:hypothetical protein [Neorhodopirellula lusitana]